MRVALAQLDFTVGAFDRNFEKMRSAAGEARRAGADLVVFTEMATTGYPPRDLLCRRDFVARSLEVLARVAALSDDRFAVLAGHVEPNPDGEGKDLYNAAALCVGGAVVGCARKCLLPTYDVFDEDRYFEPAAEVRPLDLFGRKIGVTICEDVWNDPDFWPRRRYRRDPVDELVAQGADLLVNVSASPFTLGKGDLRRQMIRQKAEKHRRAFFYANQVGGNDELVFDGHSLAFDPAGTLVLRARDFVEDLVVGDAPPPGAAVGRATSPGTVREVSASTAEEALRALVLGLRDYAHKCGFSRAVVGLSGGIDSALTAVLAARAIGPANVLGVSMPARYSSEGSVRDAEALARNLGIGYRVVPIDGVFQAYLDALAPAFEGLAADVTEENLQARVRGAVLMALSNKHGSLVLATGNKSEIGVGYCTLYGDMCGGLAVLSDVPKTFVYEIARLVNRDGEVIPASTMTKPPSAELRPGQTDQDSLPPYDVLDRVLEAYVEREMGEGEIAAIGLNRAVVADLVRKIDRAEYKRRQAAPGIKITTKAFGAGRRYPIAAEYGGRGRA